MTAVDLRALVELRVLDAAARVLPIGMCIVEAGTDRVLFANAQLWQQLGVDPLLPASLANYGAFPFYTADGALIPADERPVMRAMRGETVVAERVYTQRDGGHHVLEVSATPVRDGGGTVVAAVTTYRDVTDSVRASRAAQYLADASARLEQFDPTTSLQAILDLAVPALADAVFIHLTTGGAPMLAAGAHVDPEMRRMIQARIGQSEPLSDNTGVSRVLAGGPPELVRVDDRVLADAARDPEHLAELRARGYRDAVVAPLAGRDGVLGAVTFSLIRPGRSYDAADLAMLGELARRTGSALENYRLFLAEQEARHRAEQARDRTRRLQELTARLSGALDAAEVAQIMVSAGASALGAAAGYAWLLRRDGVLERVAAEHRESRTPETFRDLSLDEDIPLCDVVKTARPMLFESLAALQLGYPTAASSDTTSYRAWAVIPFVAGGVGIGGVSFSFAKERTFSEDDRELLLAMTGQAALALERCSLLDAERRARAQAETAQLRERQLHVAAANLSRAATVAEVGTVIAHAASEVCGAYAALAALRKGDVMHVVGSSGARNPALLARVATVPVGAALPLAECVRIGELVWASSPAESLKRWPAIAESMRETGIRACGAVPFSFEGHTVGAIGFACDEERLLSAADREQLVALAQLAAQAFERARLYEQLQTREEQLRTALSGARAGTWTVDLRTMNVVRDASYTALLGLPADTVEPMFANIYPDDIARVRDAWERAVREDAPFEPEARYRRGDGRYVWIRTHGRVLRDAAGAPTVMGGIVFDIDEAKQAQLRAEAERRINETLYQISGQFARELDADKLVQMIVDETARLIGAETGAFYDDSGTALATTGEPPEHASESRIVMPVVAAGKKLGTAVFTHHAPERFTEQHEKLAMSVATQAATALENARLYQTVRSQNDELETAIDRVRDADRRKDEFLAMLGHELRNPLAPITTALELMDLKSVGSALGKEREVIRRQVEHLSRLVDDLLDISRITGGKVALAKQVVELSTVIAKAVEMASPLLEKRAHPLVVDVPRDGMPVMADPIRLAQVFQNLLTNAAKYSEPSSEIAVRARRTGGLLIVQIVDHGMGIPPELLPNLFDMFVQGARAIDRSEGGLGLGLTIAKSLCELHGGTLDASSLGPGQGSTFTVRLPASPLPVAHSNRPTEKMPKLLRSTRVLVVDDNVDSALMLDAYLRELGHEPHIAHDGPGALEALERFVPDVAVLDIGLPVMDGYELARRLRERLGDQKLRLIAMTGYGQESDKQRAAEAGFDHHLVKPIALDALTTLLRDG